VTDDLEYPSLLNLAATFARRCGYELRVVRHRGGWLSLDEFKRAVMAVVVSSVKWPTSFADLGLRGRVIGSPHRFVATSVICGAVGEAEVPPCRMPGGGPQDKP